MVHGRPDNYPTSYPTPSNVVPLDHADSEFEFTGDWEDEEHPYAIGGVFKKSNTEGDTCVITFTGTALWLRVFMGSDCGIPEISIDGAAAKNFDCYKATEHVIFLVTCINLTKTEHTVTITVTNSKNASSSDYYVKIDSATYETDKGALQSWSMSEASIEVISTLVYHDVNPDAHDTYYLGTSARRWYESNVYRAAINQLIANLNVGGYRLTGLGAPTAQNDALRYGQAEIRNAEIAAAAAIAYSKLNLAGEILNADVAAAAAIAYSKLNLTGSVLTADIAAAEFNAANKLVKLDASADVPDAQIPNLDASKITSGTLTDARIALTTQGDVLYRNASGLARLPAGTSGQYLKTLGAGANPAWTTLTLGVNEDWFKDYLVWWDDFLMNALDAKWTLTTSGTGSAGAILDEADNGVYRLTAGPASSRYAVIAWNAVRSLLVSKNVEFEVYVKLDSAASISHQIFLRHDPTHYVGFSADTNVSSNWYARCYDGTLSSEDTGIAIGTDWIRLKVACGSSQIDFYVDGVKTNDVTTDIPTGHLEPYIFCYSRTTASKNMDVDYAVVKGDR